MKKLFILIFAVSFFYITNGNARRYCEFYVQGMLFADNFYASLPSDSGRTSLGDNLVVGNTYRIKISVISENTSYSYNTYATYTCSLDLSQEDQELLGYVDRGTLTDEYGNGLFNIREDDPYEFDEMEYSDDVEEGEIESIYIRLGFHYASEDYNLECATVRIEVYELGDPDEEPTFY